MTDYGACQLVTPVFSGLKNLLKKLELLILAPDRFVILFIFSTKLSRGQ